MKKTIYILIALLLAVLAYFLAQGNFSGLLGESMESVVSTTAILSILTVFFTELAKDMFVHVKGLGVQSISLIIAVMFSLVFWGLSIPLGLSGGLLLYIIYAFILSFTANGIYDTGVVVWLLGFFRKN